MERIDALVDALYQLSKVNVVDFHKYMMRKIDTSSVGDSRDQMSNQYKFILELVNSAFSKHDEVRELDMKIVINNPLLKRYNQSLVQFKSLFSNEYILIDSILENNNKLTVGIAHINSWLLFLYQLLVEIRPNISEFYNTHDARCQSIRKLVNSCADDDFVCSNMIFDLKISQNLQGDVENFESIIDARSRIVAKLKLLFKKEFASIPLKYIWRILPNNRIAQSAKFDSECIHIKLTIFCSSNTKISDEFVQNMDKQLTALSSELKSEMAGILLQVGSSKFKKIHRSGLIRQVLEDKLFIVIDPGGYKKSVFGTGTLGGRKQKQLKNISTPDVM